jgi:hypothetical protein
MKYPTARGFLATAALALATLSTGAPLRAEIRMSTPGTAFSPEGRPGKFAVEDVSGGGRRFRGPAFSELILRGSLRLPAANAATPRLERLVLHFRTGSSGPALQWVELLNGGKVEFHLDANLRGDYSTRETTAAPFANTWVLPSIAVSAQTVIRLKVGFGGGFDSQVSPEDFLLTQVVADFPRKITPPIGTKIKDAPGRFPGVTPPSPGPKPPTSQPPAPAPAVSSKGVIYTRTASNELFWYRHSGQQDGTFSWATPTGRRVGTGWDFKQVFSGGDGVIYAITPSGDLLWYRHDGHGDGSFRWAAASSRKVGNGWSFKQVFSGGDGVIYALTESGDLLWYRHDGRSDGTARWAGPVKVSEGWDYKQVFSGGGGVIYAVTESGDLLWFRHDGRADGSLRWAAPEGKKVGNGWSFQHLFSPGGGVIYGVTANDDLLWYRHDGRRDGSFQWAAPEGKKVGNGWNVKDVFCEDDPGA